MDEPFRGRCPLQSLPAIGQVLPQASHERRLRLLPAPVMNTTDSTDRGATLGILVMSATMRALGRHVYPTFVGFAPTKVPRADARRIIGHVPSLDTSDMRALLEIVNTIRYDYEADAFSEDTLQRLCELLGADWLTYLARDRGAV